MKRLYNLILDTLDKLEDKLIDYLYETALKRKEKELEEDYLYFEDTIDDELLKANDDLFKAQLKYLKAMESLYGERIK